jgi:4-aminobutyrate aminotransferase-like enzyme
LPVAAAIASPPIQDEKLVENAAKMGDILIPHRKRSSAEISRMSWASFMEGMVAGVHKSRNQPDPELALKNNVSCFQKWLMFSPVGIAENACK